MGYLPLIILLRGLPLVNWCCMCRCDGETVDHLLLHCKLAHAYGVKFSSVWSPLGNAEDGYISFFC